MNHGEAFCHMEYVSECGKKVVIWNSRDGVTPFFCLIEGVEYKHFNWEKDRVDLAYVPKVGDYLFVDSTIEDLISDRFIWWDMNLASRDKDDIEIFHAHFGYDKEITCRKLAEEDLIKHGEPPPRFIVATEDFVRGWKCSHRNLQKTNKRKGWRLR